MVLRDKHPNCFILADEADRLLCPFHSSEEGESRDKRKNRAQHLCPYMLCLHGMLWTQPPIYLRLFHFGPQNWSQIFNLLTFLDLLFCFVVFFFCISIVSHCLIKIYWLNTSLMPTFLGMQGWKIWASAIVSWISKRKCLYFQFLFPSTFSNKIGKQSLFVISLNVCSTMNSLGLFYSKYHLLTCENYSSLLSR